MKTISGVFSAMLAAASLSPARAWAMAKPDPQMKQVLEQLKLEGGKPIETLSPTAARRQPTPADAAKDVMKQRGQAPDLSGVTVKSRSIAGARGEIGASIYSPEGEGIKPVIVYYHGGGFVIADPKVYESSARALAKQTGAVVVSVDYRRAPEHKFPAAHDDAFAAYRWVLDHAKDIGGDPERIAVAGESAGGNLALNVSIRARDEGLPAPKHQLLIYPVAGSNMETASYKENADAKPLNRAMMGWFMENYLNSPEEAKDPRIDLVHAKLNGLPPTTIVAAQIDPLRSEGKQLEDKLRSSGVEVSYRNFDGVTHEFFGMGDVLDKAKEAQRFAVNELRQDLRKHKAREERP